jgi:hypothetical protein
MLAETESEKGHIFLKLARKYNLRKTKFEKNKFGSVLKYD